MSSNKTAPRDGQPKGRARRVLEGLTLGYLFQATVMITGLFLTPFLLNRLGIAEYGLWLIGNQVLAYLGLMDLGVIGLLPRDTGHATGLAGGWERALDLPQLIGTTASLVLWQLPFVALAAMACWLAFPASWSALRLPFLILAAGFLIVFPLRIFPSVLQGLQDLAYLGRLQMVTWAMGTAATVALVLAGFRLSAMAAGWLIGQAAYVLICVNRLRSRYPDLFPRKLPRVSWQVARSRFGRSVWLSITNVAHMFVTATDMIIIGQIMGPASVVPYNCTSKLASVLSNQPAAIMQATLPGLSEVRASETRERLGRIVSALNLSVLIFSGGIFCVVLAANEAFVSLWVGKHLYAGFALTAVVLLAMVLRHWNSSVGMAAFSFGYERRLALTNIADGIVTVVAALLLVRLFGPIGAPLASIVAVCMVSLPRNISVVTRECGVPARSYLWSLSGFAVRLTAVALCSVVIAWYWKPEGVKGFVSMAIISGVLYVAAMLPAALSGELAAYLKSSIPPLRAPLAYLKALRS